MVAHSRGRRPPRMAALDRRARPEAVEGHGRPREATDPQQVKEAVAAGKRAAGKAEEDLDREVRQSFRADSGPQPLGLAAAARGRASPAPRPSPRWPTTPASALEMLLVCSGSTRAPGRGGRAGPVGRDGRVGARPRARPGGPARGDGRARRAGGPAGRAGRGRAGAGSREAVVTLSAELRQDARRLFGQAGAPRSGPSEGLTGVPRRCASRTPTSRSCSGATGAGAPVRGSEPVAVFGKAITSRIDGSPASSITIRSRPNAMPPWGGAPRRRARSRKPNAPPPPPPAGRSSRTPAAGPRGRGCGCCRRRSPGRSAPRRTRARAPRRGRTRASRRPPAAAR